ncbi:S49 family peptidase [Acidovorax sp. NPDC077693]|uniref:S49 family peptidase n=2 Tax=unclassified Acidovorax TaxID=2684926 RepID=UPI0037CC5595
MKSYLRASSMLFNTPLMVTLEVMDLAVRWANHVMNLNIINVGPLGSERMWHDEDDHISARMQLEEQRRASIAATGISVIPVHGVLVSRDAHVNACDTMTSYESLRTAVSAAMADPMVERIALDIDSPGGAVTGAFEFAADLHAMAQDKPITGIVNFMAASAGYLIGSACTELVTSRTSIGGSIGVIASHLDRSAALERAGVKVTTVYAGAHKNDLTPNEPISDQSLATLTEIVSSSYDMFCNAVAEYRGISVAQVRATEAAVYRGPGLIDAGLADRLESPQDAVNGLMNAVQQQRALRSQSNRTSVRARAALIQSRI